MKELIQTRLQATVIGSKVPQTPKMAESMKSDSVLFGGRQTFAVECRILYETNTPSSNAAGSLWFWIGSQEVGNKHVVSLPGIAANELNQTLRWCGARHERRLFDADATTVLTLLIEVFTVEVKSLT